MKKVRIVLAAMICAALLSSVLLNTFAESSDAELWQADIRKLMDPADIPHITEIRYRNTKGEAETVETHDIACQIISGTQSCGCEFTFEMNGVEIEDWTEIQNWLGDIVTHAAATAGANSEALAQAIDKAIVSAIRNAQAKPDGTLPAWAQAGLNVSLIRVSMPFYPELSVGKNGEATKRLQQRLIELGFLDGKADGYFGAQTETAVKELEGYIRELEADAIEAHLAETPAPTATPTPTPTATPTPTPTPVPTPEPTHELTLVLKDGVTETPVALVTPTPEQTVAPTSTPMQVAEDLPIPEPMTPVDGVADALLQAYLYSESFNSARRALNAEDKGSDVTRLQVRLKTLGCSVDEPDGVFGGGTARAVRVFQYVNGLHQTGKADIATLKKLFSSDAKAPAHPMLALGSKGDDVKTLQTRLRELGFTTAGSDGDFGGNTQTAVERLQKYMRDREKAVLEAAQGKDADVTDQLTIEVNGVADPILLDDLYSASFPVVPGTLKSGSGGGDVTRLQRRLSGLEYFYGGIDGSYGGATAEAVKEFQKRHKLTQDGIAGTETLKVLFSGNALKAMKPYLLKVSIADQRVYAYGLDDNSEYTVLVRTMKCSTGKDGTDTPRGTYQATTGPGARWHYFTKFKCWAQYAYYIQGDIMFHSVLYNEKNGPVTQSSVNNLGRKASHGCVRLSVEDAKWIYTNCPMRTKVIVY